jgi:hypothetical protein
VASPIAPAGRPAGPSVDARRRAWSVPAYGIAVVCTRCVSSGARPDLGRWPHTARGCATADGSTLMLVAARQVAVGEALVQLALGLLAGEAALFADDVLGSQIRVGGCDVRLCTRSAQPGR